MIIAFVGVHGHCRTKEAIETLQNRGDVEVVFFVNGDDTLERIAGARADLLVIDDTASRGVEGFNLLDRVRAQLPELDVLMITVVVSRIGGVSELRGRSGFDAIEHGATTYLSEDRLVNLYQTVRVAIGV
ncbi:MAG: hypothetical protein BWY43_00373 [candidate division WS2 bacterium ADurb.Bin280]|uniref:Response regulatory domain-containing protein n=1 Tax=candidate division WS2 bacterium ADurb.Bin280 TaxID=1852829 RepID=A0A1V5SDZ6_9BACT|nr:MAG: hypothetical protein BWY43_00373 [candidate division WS2 bacterium ADurb.Bin280]